MIHWKAFCSVGHKAALRLASEDQLADEVLYRMKIGAETIGHMTVDHLAERRSNRNSPGVQPLSDDELADAIREANEQPQAAHPATDELTEPDTP